MNAEQDNPGVISEAESVKSEEQGKRRHDETVDPQNDAVSMNEAPPPQVPPPPAVPPQQPNFAYAAHSMMTYNQMATPYMPSPQQFPLVHHHHPPFLAAEPPTGDPASSIQFYEARMRDHAAAYASAAAGAAWAAAQMAAVAADFAAGTGPPPQLLSPGLFPQFPPDVHPAAAAPYYPEYSRHPYFEAETGQGGEQPNEHQQQPAKKRRPRSSMESGVPSRITATQNHLPAHRGRIRRRGGDDSSSTSSCSTFFKKGARKKKARSDDSLLGKTAVAALYEWCSRRNHLPSFVLQQVSPTRFDCIVSLEDDVERGRGEGRNKGAAKQAAAKQALKSLCPRAVFDDTSGFVVGLSNSVEDLAPHLAKHLAIDAADDSVSTTTELSEDESDYYKTPQGASVLSNLLFLMIQIDPRIGDSAPSFTYQMTPVLQQQPLKRKTTNSDNKRGRFTCKALLKVRLEQDKFEELQATGMGTSKREARHMSCARLLVQLFPECRGNLVDVKNAAEGARARYKATRTIARDTPLPESIQLGFRNIVNYEVTSPSSPMRSVSRRRQLDVLVEKAISSFDEQEWRNSTSETDAVGKMILRRAEPEDLKEMKHFLGKKISEWHLSDVWSPSCIVLLLCRDVSYDNPPLGCAVLTCGFQFTHGKILRVVHLVTESHVPEERFLDCLKNFASCMRCRLLHQDVATTCIAFSEARERLLAQLGGETETAPAGTATKTLQSVEEGEEEGSDHTDRRSPAKGPLSDNPSKRSRVE